MPPGQADNAAALRHSFMSVGTDRCIGVFSLDSLQCQHWLCGHPAPICHVRWKVDQDLLMVSCSDTSLCVWELSSGRLVSVLSGTKAEETLDNYCMKVYDSKGHTCATSPADDFGITSSMLVLGGSAPVHILNLNIRKILAQLATQSAPVQAHKRFSWIGTRSLDVRGPGARGTSPSCASISLSLSLFF